MKLSEFYARILSCGISRDPRKNKSVTHFEDTAILYGNADKVEVKKILVGIDLDGSELLLADKVRAQEGLDLALTHHPQGQAWARFYEVMRLQVDLMEKAGVKRSAACQLIEGRMEEVARRVHAGNHMRSVDMARLLDMPFMCAHTPADNQAAYFIEGLLRKSRPAQVQDIVDVLLTVPEYQEAQRNSGGPRIILGSGKRKAGKVFVEMTGGTEGPIEAYSCLHSQGVRTLVSMHLSEEHFKKVKDLQFNVVIAGHISSDTLGMNLLLDAVEKLAREKLKVVSTSGFRRIKR